MPYMDGMGKMNILKMFQASLWATGWQLDIVKLSIAQTDVRTEVFVQIPGRTSTIQPTVAWFRIWLCPRDPITLPRMVMEPKYYAFRRWLDIPIIIWEYDWMPRDVFCNPLSIVTVPYFISVACWKLPGLVPKYGWNMRPPDISSNYFSRHLMGLVYLPTFTS